MLGRAAHKIRNGQLDGCNDGVTDPLMNLAKLCRKFGRSCAIADLPAGRMVGLTERRYDERPPPELVMRGETPVTLPIKHDVFVDFVG